VDGSFLEPALRSAGLTAPVRWDEVTGSTNATAAAWAREGAPEWALVGAAHQTAGRGRRDRTWQDRPGDALMVSVVLRPRIAPAEVGLLSLLAGAAWAEAIEREGGLDVRCKWPNDLMAAAGKVGGILAESAMDPDGPAWVVVGSGINLRAPDDVEGAAGVGDVDPGELLAAFLSAFASGYRPGSPGFAEATVRRWTERSATIGQRVAANAADGVRIEGTAVGIDATGALVVEGADGSRQTVTSEEIVHLR
jgi:BirA family transcriptional regulator, biotin operon repressor / biotin---[acetyl-CoA-carboxylase] ligase